MTKPREFWLARWFRKEWGDLREAFHLYISARRETPSKIIMVARHIRERARTADVANTALDILALVPAVSFGLWIAVVVWILSKVAI